jgi:N-acetylmuramoyl-L-alanine amidase
MINANYVYRKDHIPRGTAHNRRPDLLLSASTITIHNTGNPTSTAANERAWLTNPSNTRTASYHIVVDAKEAIEVLPLNEVAWHAGDGSKPASGNRTSIGIELCERNTYAGEYKQTLNHAVDIVTRLLLERNWGAKQLRRHFDWSGKNCPRLMNDDGQWTGWRHFLQQVTLRLQQLKDDSSVNQQHNQQTQFNHEATIIVNGKELEPRGEVKNGVTYVPIRAVAEALGAKVIWDSQAQAVTITNIGK